MIDRIKQTVDMLVNTDGRGNVSPQEFNLAVNNAVNEIYESYPFETNRLVNQSNRGLSGPAIESLKDLAREKMQHYFKNMPLSFSAPNFTLPTDLRYIDTVFYLGNIEVDPCKNSKEFYAITNYINTRPTATMPIFLKIGSSIKVAPDTIITNIAANYMRKPLIAKWTYVVINGAEVYNPSAGDFVEIDMHPSEETNIILKVLLQFGINLKEQDVVAIASNITNTEQANENNI